MLLILPFMATLVAASTNPQWIQRLPIRGNSLDITPNLLKNINRQIFLVGRPKRSQSGYLPITQHTVDEGPHGNAETSVQVFETIVCSGGYVVDSNGNCAERESLEVDDHDDGFDNHIDDNSHEFEDDNISVASTGHGTTSSISGTSTGHGTTSSISGTSTGHGTTSSISVSSTGHETTSSVVDTSPASYLPYNRPQTHEPVIVQEPQSASVEVGYGATREPCPDGLAHNHAGECVTPRIYRNILLFHAPQVPVTIIRPESIPEPTVNYNYVFVKVPEQPQGPSPIVAPPAQQKTLLYLLRKKEERKQQLIEIDSPNNEPEVYFVNYSGEAEDQELPGGVDLRTALNAAKNTEGNIITVDTNDDVESSNGGEDSAVDGDATGTEGSATDSDAGATEDSASADSTSTANDKSAVASETDGDEGTADATAPSSAYQQPRTVVRRNAFRERLRGRRTAATSKARKPGFRIRVAGKNKA